jgi:hypothetical protein
MTPTLPRYGLKEKVSKFNEIYSCRAFSTGHRSGAVSAKANQSMKVARHPCRLQLHGLAAPACAGLVAAAFQPAQERSLEMRTR